MSIASAYLVEVYAMKKIHKEKLKSLEKAEAKRPETCNQLRKPSSCSSASQILQLGELRLIMSGFGGK
ncbi:hypothetical protein K7X08_002221 [Anisodus acutangulus]|uniref:Uncharacterized protein n=1 Tax=Anisodus acutangulus TaxID=402998 RepID=A0A9Q1LR65_9SOLA|nr:hypothetical protein K7X08_002221 [Anisodus acutangulus]